MSPSSAPSPRSDSPLVYDVESDRMVIFSGWSNLNGSVSNDTWDYDYNTNIWMENSPTLQPPGRGGHAMTYDAQSDITVLFGGSTISLNTSN